MSSISAIGTLYIRSNSGTIQSSTDNSSWSNITFPATIINDSPSEILKVVFTTNISLTSTNDFFICGSGNIQFGNDSLNGDGNIPTILIVGVSNYPGVIRNGFDNGNILTDGYNNIYVFNLYVDSDGSTLSAGAGALCQENFSLNAVGNRVLNCSTVFDSPNNGGCLIGQYAGQGGELLIKGCISYGTVGGASSGGIVGANCARSGGSVYISNCTSTGPVQGIFCGGIVGRYGGIEEGSSCEVHNCFKLSGDIIGFGCGGIYGSNAGQNLGSALAQNCFVFSNILADQSGGIFGSSAANDGTTNAINCYTTGIIGGGDNEAGGIYGTLSEVSATATNCYTSGITQTAGTGGIKAGSSTVPISCYAETNNGNSGSFSLVNASSTLTSVGTIWKTVNGLLYVNNMGSTPYSLNNIVTKNSFLQESTFSVIAGSSTSQQALPFNGNYQIIGISPSISVNASGIFSVDSSVSAGTYTITLYNLSEYSGYSLTTVILNVSTIPISKKTKVADSSQYIAMKRTIVANESSNAIDPTKLRAPLFYSYYRPLYKTNVDGDGVDA